MKRRGFFSRFAALVGAAAIAPSSFKEQEVPVKELSDVSKTLVVKQAGGMGTYTTWAPLRTLDFIEYQEAMKQGGHPEWP